MFLNSQIRSNLFGNICRSIDITSDSFLYRYD
jgi:hypothetical protein